MRFVIWGRFRLKFTALLFRLTALALIRSDCFCGIGSCSSCLLPGYLLTVSAGGDYEGLIEVATWSKRELKRAGGMNLLLPSVFSLIATF